MGGCSSDDLPPSDGTGAPDATVDSGPPTDGAWEAAPPGDGTIVAPPFPPYRRTTTLLRYDTRDVVRILAAPPTCALRHLPATGLLQGKLDLAAFDR